jgi:hypothetical protein
MQSGRRGGRYRLSVRGHQDGNIQQFGLKAGGLCVSLQFHIDSDDDITEERVPGWVLDHVDCDTKGITFTEFDGGVTLNCLTNGTEGQCNFVNVPAVISSNVPTLSEWGMISAAIGLGLIGVFFAARKRRAAVNS